MLEECSAEIVRGRFVQTADEMVPPQDRLESVRRLLYQLLDGLERLT